MILVAKSEFKGVSWNNHAQKWRARLSVNGKNTSLVYFDDNTKAAERWDEAKIATGEFVKLNFPNALAAVTARANAIAAAGTAIIPLQGAYRVRGTLSDKWYSNITIPGAAK
jgi:hypothetical protein